MRFDYLEIGKKYCIEITDVDGNEEEIYGIYEGVVEHNPKSIGYSFKIDGHSCAFNEEEIDDIDFAEWI